MEKGRIQSPSDADAEMALEWRPWICAYLGSLEEPWCFLEPLLSALKMNPTNEKCLRFVVNHTKEMCHIITVKLNVGKYAVQCVFK